MTDDKVTPLKVERKSVEPAKPKGDGLFPVKLKNHYRPAGQFEVVEETTHPYPGVGYPTKKWAGTVLRLPKDEAVGLVKKGLAERADEFTSD